ncbi:DNA-binding transcriptional regulator BolA [Buchnera aphidicola (Protaphis terricola)]|uniref:BolA/IbaG family iron-sulfur metabolism protein n=1 Tax=Buchnera aphidicola TaxID=9 RepID=UPI0034641982
MYLEKIRKYLISQINIFYIKILNNSKYHNYNNKNFITHLKIIIISDDFINKTTINRHRLIFKKLIEICNKQIYSITLFTYTIYEWEYKKHKKINFLKCFNNHNT